MIKFTKSEITEIQSLAEVANAASPDRVYESIIAKCRGTLSPEKGISIGPLETILLTESRSKCVKLATGTGYAAASKMATRLGATADDVRLVGQWLSVQGWLTPGSQTILGVLRKWDDWYPKAKALNGVKIPARDSRPSLDGPGSPTTPQRRPTL